MWFRNLVVLRLPKGLEIDAAALDAALRPHAFAPGSAIDETSAGWVPPLEGEDMLAYATNRQILVTLRQEKKLLPAKVIAQVLRQRVERIEAEEGFKPGRKRVKELKEAVRDELLPRAFSLSSDTRAWIDPTAGWLAIDAASAARADETVGLLVKAVDGLGAHKLRVERSPADAMTEWIASGDAPYGFTVDQDAELRARNGKATVRYANQSMESDDVARHIRAGKQCTRLALTWAERVSFVLTEKLEIKRLRPLDILKEASGSADAQAGAEERFAADMALMTGELSRMLAELVEALGGEAKDDSPVAVKANESPAPREAA